MRYRNIHALSDAHDKTAERAELIDDNESKPEIACFLQCGANLRLLLRNLPINQRLVAIAVQGDNMVQRFPNIYAAKHFEWSNIDFVQRQLLPKKGTKPPRASPRQHSKEQIAATL